GGKPRSEGSQVIWRQVPKVTGRGHYSHRIAFSPDGQYSFLSSGERQKFDPAQDSGVNLGKIIRSSPDGSPAPGNPFADRGGVSAQIWSYGHRNVSGSKFDEQGRSWDLEHGPAGGDELNIVKPGQNYGWPIVSNGDHYDGRPIPRHATRPEFAAPAVSWNPVIAPGDFLFYSGKAFPAWKDQASIAGSGSEASVRVAIDGESAREVERYPLGNRSREIKEAPDGTIWSSEDGKDAKSRKLGAMVFDPSIVDCWLFDLDNTLYPATTRMFDQIDHRMGAYIANSSGCDDDEARRVQKLYFQDHGTTLSGSMHYHEVSTYEFLEFVHDIDMTPSAAAPRSADRITRSPGRKIVFTNGDAPYAEKVSAALDSSDCFDGMWD
ncbi:hypothetical protein OY671_007823, partial [Metschnikowia pulcherrima]